MILPYFIIILGYNNYDSVVVSYFDYARFYSTISDRFLISAKFKNLKIMYIHEFVMLWAHYLS